MLLVMGNGIDATNRGSGALNITTGDGAITGNNINGIKAFNGSDSTDLTITTGGGDVTGYGNGINATNFSSGALSITTGGGAITGNINDGNFRHQHHY